MEARLDAYDAAVRGGEGPRTSVRYRLRKGDGDGLRRSSGKDWLIITHEPLRRSFINLERGAKKVSLVRHLAPAFRFATLRYSGSENGSVRKAQKSAMRGVQRYRFRKLRGADRVSLWTFLPSLVRTFLPSEAGRMTTLRCPVERIGTALRYTARVVRGLIVHRVDLRPAVMAPLSGQAAP